MSEEQKIPRAYEVYQHYKGTRYFIQGVFTHTETGETLVAYRELAKADATTWARPLSMWFEKVTYEKGNYCGPRYVKLTKT